MCALLLVIVFFISSFFKLNLSKSVLQSTIRMSIQLILVGIFLKYLFQLNSWIVNLLYFMVMAWVASGSVINRSGLNWRYFLPSVLFSFFFGSLFIILYFNYFIVRIPDIFDARYLISVGGMVLGNALRANVIGVGNFYQSLQKEENYYFYRLAQGATRFEALTPYYQKSMKNAVSPTIAAMSTTGIVSLPGMMTGQILAGQVPMEAIKYQIAIMITILVATLLTIAMNLWLSGHVVFNGAGILNPKVFKHPKD